MPRMPCNHCKKETCRLCYLYRTSEKYRNFWDGTIQSCRHRGEIIGKVEDCTSCNKKVDVDVYACLVHKECTLNFVLPGKMCCAICKDKDIIEMKDSIDSKKNV